MAIGKRKLMAIGGVALAVAIIGGGGGAVVAMGGDDDEAEQPITGTDLEKASAEALKHTGGGRVTGTEVGDEESLYEVEVTLDNGDQVDVQLDENFNVVGDEADDNSDDTGGPNDD
jgi:uncharacterized membrane protein YkoI